ncbi:MAG: peptide-methionine (S)-S-oxide reductase MsrA, partial [Pirellulaceae bacterium]
MISTRGKLLVLGAITVSSVPVAATQRGHAQVAGGGGAPSEQAATEGTQRDTATFGGGCFWCTEAVFQELEGIHQVISGYAGGFVDNPTYKAVCTGRTGHAEVVQLTFDPNKIAYTELLEVFWKTHDPT